LVISGYDTMNIILKNFSARDYLFEKGEMKVK
jgi:hypothetical protein